MKGMSDESYWDRGELLCAYVRGEKTLDEVMDTIELMLARDVWATMDKINPIGGHGPAIKAFLGHSSIQSTMIYATVTSDQANKILRERGLPAKLPAPEKEKGDEKTDVIWFLRE